MRFADLPSRPARLRPSEHRRRHFAADPDSAARYHQSCHRRVDGRDLFHPIANSLSSFSTVAADLSVKPMSDRLLASIRARSQRVQLPIVTNYFVDRHWTSFTKAAGDVQHASG